MNKFSLVIILTSMIFVIACDRVIEEGELGNLRIGQSKREVLVQLINDRVGAVIPEPDEAIVIKRQSIDTISRLERVSGICLTDNTGVNLKLRFNGDNILTNIVASVRARADNFGIEINQSKIAVIALLRKVILNNKNTVVSNCIPDVRWTTLKEHSKEDIAYLEEFNTWAYNQPNSYSHVVLKFLNGILVKIIYYWRPYEW